MRILIVAAVAALALGFTIKDLGTSSGNSPEENWENRAEDAGAYLRENPIGNTQEELGETGTWLKDWLLAHADGR